VGDTADKVSNLRLVDPFPKLRAWERFRFVLRDSIGREGLTKGFIDESPEVTHDCD
jgi:hypothetical protein